MITKFGTKHFLYIEYDLERDLLEQLIEMRPNTYSALERLEKKWREREISKSEPDSEFVITIFLQYEEVERTKKIRSVRKTKFGFSGAFYMDLHDIGSPEFDVDEIFAVLDERMSILTERLLARIE